MDKVYVVWYDNGEPYEDNYSDIKCIFSSYDAAAKYLDSQGYERYDIKLWNNSGKYVDSVAWRHDMNYICKEGYDRCENCRKYMDWVYSDYEDDEPCDEYCYMFDPYDSNANESWTIREWVVAD